MDMIEGNRQKSEKWFAINDQDLLDQSSVQYIIALISNHKADA